jgi:uncharacterized membrane protein YdbT with pleckstrin-like domain
MSKRNDDVLWQGKPWIMPQIAWATIVVGILCILVVWLEIALGHAWVPVIGIALLIWTVIVFAVIWLIWVLRYVLERASEKYTLRKIGLEVERGILSKRNIVLSTGGFSDMQVYRSIIGRMLNVGDIVIRSEGEHDIRLRKIRNPKDTMDKIRDVMSRPLVKFSDETKPSEQRKPFSAS